MSSTLCVCMYVFLCTRHASSLFVYRTIPWSFGGHPCFSLCRARHLPGRPSPRKDLEYAFSCMGAPGNTPYFFSLRFDAQRKQLGETPMSHPCSMSDGS